MINKIYRADGTTLIPKIKSVVYTEAVNADTDLRPGCAASAFIKVEVYGAQSSAPYAGEKLTYYQADVHNNQNYIGTFYAEPAVNSKTTYSFTAYDAMHKLDVDFSAHLASIQNDFPMSLADIVDEALGLAGLDNATPTFPMYDMDVNAFYASNLTARDIISYAAEIAGCFARVDANGDIEFAWYANKTGYRIYPSASTSLTEIKVAYKQSGLSYANYAAAMPNCVAVRPSGTDGVAYIYPSNVPAVYATDPNSNGNVVLHNITAVESSSGEIVLSGDFTATDANSNGNVAITSSGGTSNPMVIANNILLTGASAETMEDVAENIYDQMALIPTYRPASASLFPGENPFRVGDIVAVTDSQGVSFNLVVMRMTVSPTAAVVEATGNEVREERDYTDKTLTQLAADIVQINKLKVDWAEINEAIINTVEANELKSSDFQAANDGIFADAGMEINLASKTIKATDFAVGSNGKLYASLADISGVNYSLSISATQQIESLTSLEYGYTMMANPINYRDIMLTEIVGISRQTVAAKFEYYSGSTLVGDWVLNSVSVSNFYIPLGPAEADKIRIGIKLSGETNVKLAFTIRTSTYPIVRFPHNSDISVESGSSVDFADGITVDGITLDSTTIVAGKRFTVASNGSTTITVDSGTSGIIMFSGYGNGTRGIYFYGCNANGHIQVTDGIAANVLTLTASTNSITVASTGTYSTDGILIKF